MSKLLKHSGKSYLVRDYLIHSYLYYELDVTLIDDHEFNLICKELATELDNIEHMHKYLVDRENLDANTGYDIKYPTIVKHCAEKLYKIKTGNWPQQDR